jgi:hypothetical protein
MPFHIFFIVKDRRVIVGVIRRIVSTDPLTGFRETTSGLPVGPHTFGLLHGSLVTNRL